MGPETGRVDADITSHPGTDDITLLQCSQEHWLPCRFSKQQTTSAFKGTCRRHIDFSGDFPLTEVS